MSPRSSSKSVSGSPVEKPGLNIYTVMLIISLVSVSLSCLLLYLELSQYGSFPWWDAR